MIFFPWAGFLLIILREYLQDDDGTNYLTNSMGLCKLYYSREILCQFIYRLFFWRSRKNIANHLNRRETKNFLRSFPNVKFPR